MCSRYKRNDVRTNRIVPYRTAVDSIYRAPKAAHDGEVEWRLVDTIHLGIENPGTQIAEYEHDIPMQPNPAVIRVTTPKGSFRPHSMGEFRGLVHIGDTQEALRFVRFRTSRKYCYNWTGENTPQEIVSFSQYTQPDFADTAGPNETGQISQALSGRYGNVHPLAILLPGGGHFDLDA